MATTVSAFITELDTRYPNPYTNTNKVGFINNVELSVYNDINEEYRTQYYNRAKGTYQYDLPTGVLFEDVSALYVDNKRYYKKHTTANKDDYMYFYDQDKLNIYPVSDTDDTQYVSLADNITFKAISYTSGASEITFTHNTITTSGTAFTDSAFVVGNTVWISGCIDTNNNKTAVITGVAASVLTFADNTFDADTTADTGTINIATNCIYTSGAEFSGFQTGEITLVSGCTDETDNNKYAILFAVADSVLTFPLGTFTAQVETSAVTISQPTIKMVYRYRRTSKLVANIATDTLLLPDRFHEIYYLYCYAQMAMLNRDFAEYNNWVDMYRVEVAEYQIWYESQRPKKTFVLPNDSWGDPYDTSDGDE